LGGEPDRYPYRPRQQHCYKGISQIILYNRYT